MSTTTLTSLAILKVNIDHGRDYLDYLRPLILHVLVKRNPDHITDQIVKEYIYDEFGLVIPEQTIHIVLRRISKSCDQIEKTHGVYKIVDTIPDPKITMKLNEARIHIQAVVTDLIEFSKNIQKFPSSRHAEIAICAFLEKFDISCLRAYLRGTTIPNLEGKHNASIIIVSKYVIYLQKTNPERFNSFMIMVQGNMLANALLCPDLQHISGTYNGVMFYLDTPLLIQRMGLEGMAKQRAVKELIELLKNLEGKIFTFSHSREELYNVLRGAAEYLDTPNGRGAIITEARRQGTTKSDLLLLAEKIDSELDDADIGIKSTPHYISDFQIDETAFEDILDDEVSYHNPRAKQYDINSVRSIYVLRGKKQPLSLEKSSAILVTNNSAFARAAWNYGNEHELSHNVSHR